MHDDGRRPVTSCLAMELIPPFLKNEVCRNQALWPWTDNILKSKFLNNLNIPFVSRQHFCIDVWICILFKSAIHLNSENNLKSKWNLKYLEFYLTYQLINCSNQQYLNLKTLLKFWLIIEITKNLMPIWKFDLRIFLVYGDEAVTFL